MKAQITNTSIEIIPDLLLLFSAPNKINAPVNRYTCIIVGNQTANSKNGRSGYLLNLKIMDTTNVRNTTISFTPSFSANNIIRAYTKPENKKLLTSKLVLILLSNTPMVISITNNINNQMSFFDLMK